jgi:hypothetical protein
VLIECRFDLAQLDSITSDLYLVVDSSEELDIPVCPITSAISGAVKVRSRLIAERAEYEFLGG